MVVARSGTAVRSRKPSSESSSEKAVMVLAWERKGRSSGCPAAKKDILKVVERGKWCTKWLYMVLIHDQTS